MVRKNLLKGLMEEAAKAPSTPPEESREAPSPNASDASGGSGGAARPTPRYTKGAIGAVSQSIAALKARSVVDLDPHAITAGGLKDRLEFDDAAHAQLMQSLKTYGQQVPILVRPDPAQEGRYQIVYGRRRVLALRDLGMSVKALVRDLDDDAVILAQGQENSARRDLSFLERVNFARQMRDAGYERAVICDALTVDKTLLSRMLQVADTVPVEVIEKIGAAPGIGRDRWLSFCKYWVNSGWDAEQGEAMLESLWQDTSDARFEVLLAWLAKHHSGQVTAAKGRVPGPQIFLSDGEGKLLGKIQRRAGKMRIELERKTADGFDDWLEANIEEIFRDWKAKRGK